MNNDNADVGVGASAAATISLMSVNVKNKRERMSLGGGPEGTKKACARSGLYLWNLKLVPLLLFWKWRIGSSRKLRIGSSTPEKDSECRRSHIRNDQVGEIEFEGEKVGFRRPRIWCQVRQIRFNQRRCIRRFRSCSSTEVYHAPPNRVSAIPNPLVGVMVSWKRVTDRRTASTCLTFAVMVEKKNVRVKRRQ
jgi:hypothetical protein